MEKNSFLVALLVLGLALGSVDCLGKFIRGRRFEKESKDKLNGLRYPPEQYFDQRLDHFDETLTTTWKQVLAGSILFAIKFFNSLPSYSFCCRDIGSMTHFSMERVQYF